MKCELLFVRFLDPNPLNLQTSLPPLLVLVQSFEYRTCIVGLVLLSFCMYMSIPRRGDRLLRLADVGREGASISISVFFSRRMDCSVKIKVQLYHIPTLTPSHVLLLSGTGRNR